MTKIYLASSNFKPFHADWIKRAKTALTDNSTVDIVHNPWDHQYKNVSFDDTTGLFGSLEWQLKTYQNDKNAMGSSDIGVYLIDVDEQDEGLNMELGFMTALHKPNILIFLSHSDTLDKEFHVNLMIAQAGTYFIHDDIEALRDYDFSCVPSNLVEDMGDQFKVI